VANLASVEAQINGLPVAMRPLFFQIFRTILRDLRFGHPTFEASDPCENFGAGFFHGTTAAVADTEFSIAHGFGRVPYLVIPVLPLDTVGAQIVPLTVTRVADDKRLYFSSPTQSASVSVYVEG
jgi:hypothetical protein